MNATLAGAVLLINSIVLIWATTKSKTINGVSIFFSGDCAKAKTLELGAHVARYWYILLPEFRMDIKISTCHIYTAFVVIVVTTLSVGYYLSICYWYTDNDRTATTQF